MLPQGSKINVVKNQELWAPDVFYTNDQFYAYYSVSRIGLQTSDIGVATSKDAMPGTWTDHGSVGLPTKTDKLNYNRIDPNFFMECPTCDPLFQFGSAWNDVYQTTLKNDLLTWSGSEPQQKLFNSTLPAKQDFPSITEGSFLFWWNLNGKKYYYMFFSAGACCNAKDGLAAPGDEYKIMVCRSESATGTYVDKEGRDCLTEDGGTLVLGSHGNVYAPGGQGVIVDPKNGKIALYYHYGEYRWVRVSFG
jgi:arabinan endo-1,5-alpha-L-arabinosidase